MNNMKIYRANKVPFAVICHGEDSSLPRYPLLTNNNGTEDIYSPSPLHGRSFVVGRHDDGRYVVTKGNGLCYSQHTFLYTPEMPTDVWGLLIKDDAMRDFNCCNDVKTLGIKTNTMEYVLELDCPLHIKKTDADIKPYLLQYSVECPYRICDAAFMDRKLINAEVAKWQAFNISGWKHNHQIAADVLVRNLRIMHDNDVLHNAIHEQNYTWALELLDFELCRTPQHPYSSIDYERHVPDLFDREIIFTYIIINYIAGVLHEDIDFGIIDSIFEKNGIKISKYSINQFKK